MSETTLSTRPAAGPGFSPADRYRDIAVHLDGSPEDETRLAHAEALAVSFQARLTGIFVNPLPDPAVYVGDFGMLAVDDLRDAVIENGNATEPRLQERLARLAPPHELRRIDASPGMLEEAVASEARWNDLFVATCPRGRDNARWSAMVESVMFNGGRGLFLVPPQAPLRSVIRTVLVAWVDNRQSARAVAEALPFLRQAGQVHVVTVSEKAHGRMGGAEALADITAHLVRHGVEATATVLGTEASPADGLLAEAGRVGADLIVAGAYGHSRFREWILGGVTEDLLANSPLPLLVAH